MMLAQERKLAGLLVLFICCLTGGRGTAQIAAGTFDAVAPETFSNSFVRCFYKDSKGFMWVGTADGLVRYDGTNSYFYEHLPDDSSSLCHNNINVIIEDPNTNLWVGTSMGLCIYDREKDRFINVNNLEGNKNQLNNEYITDLAFDDYQRVWIGTLGGGVNVYDPGDSTFTFLAGEPESGTIDASRYINRLLPVDGEMWCGTKSGLRIYNTSELAEPSWISGRDLPGGILTAIIQDHTDNIWMTTSTGKLVSAAWNGKGYSFTTRVEQDSVPDWGNILVLREDGSGNLWIAGENSGLNHFNTTTGKITRYTSESDNPKCLPTNSIRDIYVDDQGLTWIGTYNKGAFLFNRKNEKFNDYGYGDFKPGDFSDRNVRAFAEDSDSNIWIACDGIGLLKLEAKSNVLRRQDALNERLHSKYITSLHFDSNGHLWAGSADDGLVRINLATGQADHFNLESGGFGDNRISYIYEDATGTIWTGTFGSGLFRFDPEAEQFHLFWTSENPHAVSRTAYVSHITEDPEGRMWVSTMYGLYVFSRQEGERFGINYYKSTGKAGSISSSSIQAVCFDHNGLWVGTTDNGLNLKAGDARDFRVFQKSNGLASNVVRGIISDQKGKLWVAGNKGLSVIDSRDNGPLIYTTEDGLASNNFYGNAVLLTSAGKLFFGTNNGFNAFHPDSISVSHENSLIHLTNLKINNQPVRIGDPGSPLEKHISLTSAIELPYEQRSFAIDFVSLNYGRSSKQKYCYMLEGFDKGWNCIGSGTTATFTNLDPGDYTFLVKASNGIGEWSDNVARLDITILPLPWKSWWAITMYVIALVVLLYFLNRIRLERLKMKHQIGMEQLAREREHEISEAKSQFFTNISHEFRTPLSLIAMPLESLLSVKGLSPSVKGKLSTMQSSVTKMLRLVNDLMDFNKLEAAELRLSVQEGELISAITGIAGIFTDLAEKRSVRYTVSSNVSSLVGWFDYYKLEIMLTNILSNAFKFTAEKGEVSVLIDHKEISREGREIRCVQVTIVDNGVGISQEELPLIFDKFYQAKSSSDHGHAGTGIGLALTRGLVELHHGFVDVRSEPGRETRFIILLPIDRSEFDEEEISANSGYFISPDASFEMDPPDVEEENALVKKTRILLVEDNEELRQYMQRELSATCTVLEARDGKEGLEIAREKCPDLIISDIMMPGHSGMELCRNLKTNLETSHIPVILLTAKSTVDDEIRGTVAGADLYVTKPFNIRCLQAHVSQIIESRQTLYERFSQDIYFLSGKGDVSDMDNEFLLKAKEYVIENILDSQLSVDSMASLFNLSRMQVYRKIKALTGKSVVEFIRVVRLRQALKLMETQQYTFTEIAYQTGFNSASYFTRCFKDHFGKAPSEYLEYKLNN